MTREMGVEDMAEAARERDAKRWRKTKGPDDYERRHCHECGFEVDSKTATQDANDAWHCADCNHEKDQF